MNPAFPDTLTNRMPAWRCHPPRRPSKAPCRCTTADCIGASTASEDRRIGRINPAIRAAKDGQRGQKVSRRERVRLERAVLGYHRRRESRATRRELVRLSKESDSCVPVPVQHLHIPSKRNHIVLDFAMRGLNEFVSSAESSNSQLMDTHG